MPTLLLQIESYLDRKKKDRNDFKNVSVVKIFANGLTDPESGADF